MLMGFICFLTVWASIKDPAFIVSYTAGVKNSFLLTSGVNNSSKLRGERRTTELN